MITRIHGKIVFECDGCNETLETKENDFQCALAILRHEGWKSKKIGKDWIHKCEECSR